MKRKITIALALLVTSVSLTFAQGRRGLRINEVMVVNDSNFIDDYGRNSAWIELFNTTFAPLEISSVYITNDKNNPTLYPVPLGDVNTRIPKRQHILFWADNRPSDGTFHMNFTLTPGEDNWIGIYDADGKTLIDEVLIPASLPAGASYARKMDGEGTGDEAWEVRDGKSASAYVTPSSNNVIKDTNNKVKMFSEKDENGFGMTVMAMCIVFGALLLLSISFYVISKIGEKISKRNKIESHGLDTKDVEVRKTSQADSGEEIAAIVMALHDHLNAHDSESTVLTIKKMKRAYSPWSSKIYGLRELPRR